METSACKPGCYYIGMRYAVASGFAVIVSAALGWDATAPWFEDRTAASGIRFVLRNGATGGKHQIETMVGGAAVLDYDRDGLPDLFFANGAAQPSLEKKDPSYSNRLYRNRGDWKFDDVTTQAGLGGEGYSIGAAAGDFDHDGYPDLYVAGVDRSFLYRNRRDGTFADVTASAGVANPGKWAVAAGWFDYDGDSRLDLFVANYVHWDPAKEPFCGDPKAYRTYCHPQHYTGLPNTLYRNNGDGTFRDVSESSGIARHVGKGMGVAFADYDGDGRVDIFVANDTVPNFLFHNEGNGTFRETGLRAGVAINDDGRALSSMGVDFRDLDNDGRADLFVSALANETFPLYRNLGGGLFADVTYRSRIGAATLAMSGWGVGAYDFDNDGRRDLFVACSDVNDNTELFSSRKSRQPNLLLAARAGGAFTPHEISHPAMHRGAAFGDFDVDGRIDAVITRIGESPLLLRNTSGAGNHWIGLRLPIGARVRISTADGEQWGYVTTSVGYASSSEDALHFGLGSAARVKAIEIIWPSGKKQRMENVSADRYITASHP